MPTSKQTLLIARSHSAIETAYGSDARNPFESHLSPSVGWRWRCTRLHPLWSKPEHSYGSRKAAEGAAVRAILDTVLASAHPALFVAQLCVQTKGAGGAEPTQDEIDFARETASLLCADLGAEVTDPLPVPSLDPDRGYSSEDFSRGIYQALLPRLHADDRDHDPDPALPPVLARAR